MTEVSTYLPPRKRGIVIHLLLMIFLIGLAVLGASFAALAEVGLPFSLYILLTLVGALPFPLIAYRFYALLRANYHLGREKLILNWGLRIEKIPLSDIEWVRPATALTTPLRLPRLRLPGSILGMRRHADLGTVEFLASDAKKILLIATAKQVFAISPDDPRRFAREFQLATELGSLSRTDAFSTYPTFIIVEAWRNLLIRYLWISGILLNIALLAWTSFLIPQLETITLGFGSDGLPRGAFPPVQLMLLPLINSAFFVIGWMAGLYFYRWEEQKILAFILWASGTLMGVFFLVGIYFSITV